MKNKTARPATPNISFAEKVDNPPLETFLIPCDRYETVWQTSQHKRLVHTPATLQAAPLRCTPFSGKTMYVKNCQSSHGKAGPCHRKRSCNCCVEGSTHLFLSAWCMSITPIPPPADMDCSGWLIPCLEAPKPDTHTQREIESHRQTERQRDTGTQRERQIEGEGMGIVNRSCLGGTCHDTPRPATITALREIFTLHSPDRSGESQGGTPTPTET